MNNHRLEFPPIPNPGQNELNWAYSMRRDMQEIIPGIFLGPYAAAMKSKFESLKNNGITHIICVRQSIEANFIRPNFLDSIKYLVLDVADCVTENIIQFLPLVREFLDECQRMGGCALVHGNAGISRSAAFVIGYLMEKYGLSYRDTFYFVQQRRFCINPNEGFVQQLQEYEPIYQAKLSSLNGEPSTSAGNLKRKHIDDQDDIGYS